MPYRNCAVPRDFMRAVGAAPLESCVETRLSPASFTPVFSRETLSPVTENNFAAFRAIHDRANPAMYWTGDRVARDLRRWHILLCGNSGGADLENGRHKGIPPEIPTSYVMMSLWGDVPEIFAVEAADAREGAALLTAVAEYAFAAGKASVLNMVDDSSAMRLEAARLTGFAPCGTYAAYRGVVGEWVAGGV